jgi:hypothetical protein
MDSIKTLTLGEYTITFSGKLDLSGLIPQEGEIIVDAGATYNLNVIPKYF